MGFLSTAFTKAAVIFLIGFVIINSLGLYFYARAPNMFAYYSPSKPYSHSPPEGLKYDYLPFNYSKNYTRNKFTVVMPTYNRSNQLPIIIGHYCNISNVHKILVLWNNVGEPVPDQIKDFKCRVPVKIKIMKENNLTSRFWPYPEIETEAIFSVDDDRMVDPRGMEKSFAAWKLSHK
ncbi:PREDICTED: exostosin-like 2 [Amphimedon queenslandica]|uniref:Glycosyl transferase 64 domain-containing protein n=1 Tax=Amphimedon queenslandica TaxID=400682 RepID=A0AAN0IZ43_AMPQE|nr:PREDICTED: exostosin-like 2 [Amphimedon queenslandica]|eukprot:XP_019850044.1 PREDICTED: exostosin-like 2 [Amphimedon queenslandica]